MQEANKFCKNYVSGIFKQFDPNQANILRPAELNAWLKHEKQMRPLQKRQAEAQFHEMVAEADANKDGNLDRQELFQYCVKNYNTAKVDD